MKLNLNYIYACHDFLTPKFGDILLGEFQEFEQRVRGIGHVLALMTPWDEPALRLKMVASKSVCLYNLLVKQKYVCL